MDEFEFEPEDVEEFECDDEVKLARIYELTNKLISLLDELKSFELREAAALMIIRELVEDDKILLGLATKMLQDLSYGFENDESYVS
ncbi:MAG: hypothetical protein ABWW66_01890 [Archaeoglobaceae archaeon]